MILIDQGAPRRPEAARRLQILDAEGKAMEQVQIIAAHNGLFGSLGGLPGALFVHRDDGVQGRVDL